MVAPVIQALIYDPPLLNPSPQGLYPATTWTEETGPARFLSDGVKIRPFNYGGSDAFGVWDEEWCDPLDRSGTKYGERPDMDPDPFQPITVWAYDECDPSVASQREVETRAAQVLKLEEQTAVEAAFAIQLLADAGAPAAKATITEAVAYLEGEIAKTNTVGQIHAGAHWASIAGTDLILSSGGTQRTLLGHRWVFGGGYVTGLDATLVATSQVFGWRDAVQVRTALKPQENLFTAIAERSVVLGYEKLIAAVTIAP